jgi:hypothetical protein
MFSKLKTLWLHPAPLRLLTGTAVRRLGLLPYQARVEFFMEQRQHYAYATLRAAQLAKKLGINRISVIEFGVAGGNGLLNLEYHAQAVEKMTGVTIDIYGFDTGEGLPQPQDYRDLPYHWKAGFFRMEKDVLLAKLSKAKIIFGDVAHTAKTFTSEHNPAPIGAIFHDLDFYSSTKASFAILDGESQYRLPRIFNYFDDIIGDEIALYNPYTGQLAAIEEYNHAHEKQKFTPPQYLKKYVNLGWIHQYFVYHDFVHPRYNDFISTENQQLPYSKV